MPSQLPKSGFVRLHQIIGDKKANPPLIGIIPVSKTTWYEGVKSGRYPPSVKLTEYAVGWPVADILRLVKSIESHGRGLAKPAP